MKTLKNQSGISLVMALIMLVVLTLTAISSTSSVNSSIRIAGNMMNQDEVLTATQMAIDKQLGTLASFTTAVDSELWVDINRDGTMDYKVKLYAPVCYQKSPAQQDESTFTESGSTPSKTYWDVKAEVTDDSSGASTTVQQGVWVILYPGMGC